MVIPSTENPVIGIRLTRSAGDALAGTTVLPDPALIHAQVGDHVQPEGGPVLRIVRRTWRMDAGGAALELLLDWPAR